MKRTPLTVRDMVYCAICAALLAICAWLSVPVAQISFTMQSFAVFFSLGLLGGRRGTVSIVIYLFLGLVGLPVFSGFRGGVSVLLGVTGGYIWGFFLAALVYWALTVLFGDIRRMQLVSMILGMAACYGCGTAWYVFLYGGGFRTVLAVCVVPYLIPDGVKIALALILSGRLKKILKF